MKAKFLFAVLLSVPFCVFSLNDSEDDDPSVGVFADSRDGQTYTWVRIGDQIWMAENLNWTPADDHGGWSGCYDNDDENCYIYGRLYTWLSAMQGATMSVSNPSGVQGACPPGWHLPSDEEWKQLEMHLGMTQAEADGVGYRAIGKNVGTRLKAKPPSWDGNDAYGFSALKGGQYLGRGTFFNLGNNGIWWTATESNAAALIRGLVSGDTGVSRGNIYKGSGLSVRCVRDK